MGIVMEILAELVGQFGLVPLVVGGCCGFVCTAAGLVFVAAWFFGLRTGAAVGAVLAGASLRWIWKHGYRVLGFGPRPRWPRLTLPDSERSSSRVVRFVAISDTHNDHARLQVPDGA